MLRPRVSRCHNARRKPPLERTDPVGVEPPATKKRSPYVLAALRDSRNQRRFVSQGAIFGRIVTLVQSLVPKEPADPPSHRLYSCARCRRQVVICRRCDRGNVYCFAGCARLARRDSIRRAARRYQKNEFGARNHARRQRHYRARREKVTHHGSVRRRAALRIYLAVVAAFLQLVRKATPAESRGLVCHRCGRSSDGFLRQSFLHHSEVPG